MTAFHSILAFPRPGNASLSQETRPVGRITAARRRPAMLLAWLVLAHTPLLVWFTFEIWRNAEYHFAPLLWIAAAWIGWERVQESNSVNSIRSGKASALAPALLFVLSLLCLTVATVTWWPRMGVYSLALGTGALTLAAGGKGMLRALAPSLALVAISIPPPLGLNLTLATALQGWVVSSASSLLDLLNVPHRVLAHVIEVPGKTLLVEEACSGIHSLFAMVGLTLLLALWQRRGILHTLLLICTAVCLVVAGNLLRVTAGAALLIKCRWDLFTEPTHGYLGMGLFVVCLLLVASIDQLFYFLLPAPKPAEGWPAEASTTSAPRGDFFSRRGWLKLWMSGYGVLFALQLGSLWVRGAEFPAMGVESRLGAQASFDLPHSLDGWDRSGADEAYNLRIPAEGTTARTWQYQCGNVRATVALDFPFTGFHDVTQCYESAGWDIRKYSLDRTRKSGVDSAIHAVLNQQNVQGDLLFCLCDENGRWLDPHTSIDYSIRGRLGRWPAKRDEEPVASYQIQVFCAQYQALSQSDRDRLARLFLAARRELAAQIVSQVKK